MVMPSVCRRFAVLRTHRAAGITPMVTFTADPDAVGQRTHSSMVPIDIDDFISEPAIESHSLSPQDEGGALASRSRTLRVIVNDSDIIEMSAKGPFYSVVKPRGHERLREIDLVD
jgi:hypothetical protein